MLKLHAKQVSWWWNEFMKGRLQRQRVRTPKTLAMSKNMECIIWLSHAVQLIIVHDCIAFRYWYQSAWKGATLVVNYASKLCNHKLHENKKTKATRDFLCPILAPECVPGLILLFGRVPKQSGRFWHTLDPAVCRLEQEALAGVIIMGLMCSYHKDDKELWQKNAKLREEGRLNGEIHL